MNNSLRIPVASSLAIVALAIVGCATRVTVAPSVADSSTLSSMLKETEGNFPDRESDIVPVANFEEVPITPFSVRDSDSQEWQPPAQWDLTIDETIQLALTNATILRNLGARVIQAPESAPTIYEPALQATDPTGGVEAALSEFDARVTGDLFNEENDRVLNNAFSGNGENFFIQSLTRLESSLSKQTASGTLYTLRHNFDAEANNSDQNLLGAARAWTWNFEGEFRHPLLQGRGVAFNRVAGPNGIPGVYNGVIIARLNADVTATQLEIALRDYLSDVENAYWDLYFAYADLEVKKQARDRSLNTYLLLKARSGLPGAEDDKVAQAKEQYFRFEQDVQDALAGRLVVGTRAFNGSGGGTFQGSGGVYVAERRLRLVMGMSINDGRLIRPASVPSDAPLAYDWNDLVVNALSRRTELRKQRLTVKKSRHELTASRNFLLPRLDAVGQYRYRALGDGYFDTNIIANSTAVGTGTHEWLMGLSLEYPVGMRQAHAAVRNAALRLARERALLAELERQVIYGLSNAIAECDRAYATLRTALNRENAAKEQYNILAGEAQAPVRQFDFNSLLDSEQRFAEAATAANRARVQYELATKNLNFEMGALLEYLNIHLAETARRNVSTAQDTSQPFLKNIIDRIAHVSPTKRPSPKRPNPTTPSPATPSLTRIATLPAAQESKDLPRSEESFYGEDLMNQIINRELAEQELAAPVRDPNILSPSDR